MKLLVVIVNYRTPELSIDCLRSLEPEVAAIPGTRVVVVDNASGDSSVERIEAEIASKGWRSWVDVLRSARNGGFAYGNNLAIEPALESEDAPEYIHLLNPDTVIHPGALQKLLAFLEAHAAAGIAGSLLESPAGDQYASAFRFYSLQSEFEEAISLSLVSRLLRRWCVVPPLSGREQQVDWVCGASMMVRREVFDTAGYFDEEYFLYYEEADFCLQSHRAGWECWYVPESRVTHVLSGATDVLREANRRPRYWFESRRHYFVKNHGRLFTVLANLLWMIGFALWKLRRYAMRQPAAAPPYVFWDFARYSFFDRKRR
jgi:GT2 family glycosyltransferase